MIELVLATVRRTEEPLRFLRSLETQTSKDFRLIVVDQNEDGRLDAALDAFERTLPLLHIRSGPGLSHARNAALPHLAGDIVAFPDDDCWYPASLVEQVGEVLASNPDWDGVTGRSVDEELQTSNARWAKKAGKITAGNVWTRAVSYTIFLRRPIVDEVGAFDETLGVGAGTPWGASEEIDFLLRALARGASLHYDPNLIVHHPQTREQFTDPDPAIGNAYAMGMGRVLRKNGAPLRRAAYHVGRACGGALLNVLAARPPRARFHWNVAKGRLRGWRSD